MLKFFQSNFRISFIFLIAISALLGTGARAASVDNEEIKGSLAIIGGALRFDNAVVWQRIVANAGGEHAKIAVIPAASANPERSGEAAVATLRRYGADAFLLPLSPKYRNKDGKANYREVNRDAHWLTQIGLAGGVFFTGGDQTKITSTLLEDDGKRTPLLDAIWAMYQRGGVIAGTSAGAAIMSETMFSKAGTVFDTLKNGVRDGHEIAPGLGFIGKGIFVDQHLIIRGRFARMLAAMQKKEISTGLGIDENSALFVHQQKEVEVLGYKGMVLIDLSNAEKSRKGKNFNIQNAQISYLSHGDKLNLETMAITASPEKSVLAGSEEAMPSSQPKMYADVLANSVVLDLMIELLESGSSTAKGLAFNVNRSGSNAGFVFTFRKTPETKAFYTNSSGADAYTIVKLTLDVAPVGMKLSFFQQIK